MKARWAVILSASGVLTAGTAAAVVNSQVLRQESGAGVTAPVRIARPRSGFGEVSTSPTTVVPTVPYSTVSTRPPTTLTPILTPTTVALADTVVTQQQFRLGDAATAILDTADEELTIVTVAPHPGWVVERAEQEDPTTVEIRLSSANEDVRFEATLVRGVVAVSLRADDSASDQAVAAGGDEDPPDAFDVDGDDGDSAGSDGDDSGSGRDDSGSGNDDEDDDDDDSGSSGRSGGDGSGSSGRSGGDDSGSEDGGSGSGGSDDD
jgi:hypothetical protein